MTQWLQNAITRVKERSILCIYVTTEARNKSLPSVMPSRYAMILSINKSWSLGFGRTL